MGYEITQNYLTNYLTAKSEQFLVLTKFIELIASLSSSFPDLDIVVRPHPTEDPEA